MRPNPFFILLVIASVIVSLVSSVLAESSNNLTVVNTRSGSYPLPAHVLRLPDLPIFSLVSVSEAPVPELPDWHSSRFVPDDPGWLDRSGKYYKEGIVQLFRGNLSLALMRFQTVIEEYPETDWLIPSRFWQGQIFAQRQKYAQSAKSLNLFLNSLKQSRYSERYIDFQDFSRYTLAWLTFKQKKYNEVTDIIEKYENKIDNEKIRSRLLYLRYLANVKLNKNKATLSVLEKLIKDFPNDFEHILLLGEFYYSQKSWRKLTSFVATHAKNTKFYNDSKMEHFLWLGLDAHLNLKQWNKAKKLIRSLEKLGVQSTDKLAKAYLKLNLHTKQIEQAWKDWMNIEDQILRVQALRALFHRAVKVDEFNFLLKLETELKSINTYWRSWQDEVELIYAYLYLRLNQIEKSKTFLESSNKYSLKGDDTQSSIVNEESLFLSTVIELISSNYQRAFILIKQLLESYPDSDRLSDYYFWYGVLQYEIEKNSMQTIMAMRQVDINGNRADDLLFLLAKVNHDQQNWAAVNLSLLNLKKFYPGSPFLEEGLYLQSQATFEQKQYNLALEILNELQNTFDPLKKPVRAIDLRVRILMAMQRYEQADDVLRRSITMHADFSLIKLRIEVLKHINDPRRIIGVTGLGLGISISEDQGFLFFHQADALYEMKQYEQAYTVYNFALKNPPENKSRFINYRILKTHYELGRIDELEQGASLLLGEVKDDDYASEILHLLSDYFLERKQKEKAKPYLKQLVANYEKSVRQEGLEPEQRVEQIVLIGEIYNDLDEYEQAERWLNHALKSMETVEDGRKKWQLRILREKGFALFKLDKHSKALAASLKVLYLDRSMSDQQMYDLNLRIASSYVKLNRNKEAKAIYRKMLNNFEDSDRQKEVEALLGNLM